MKAVLMSIKPKYCELIAKGKKTIEVRKTKPKLETPFKVYIYCTKDKNNWFFPPIKKPTFRKANYYEDLRGNGKVIGEFVCDTIITDRTFGHDALFKAIACMDDAEIAAYCINNEMYGWHISDLVIYDRPKELSEFIRICPEWEKGRITDRCLECEHLYTSPIDQFLECDYEGEVPITRSPQSWCYVEETESLEVQDAE